MLEEIKFDKSGLKMVESGELRFGPRLYKLFLNDKILKDSSFLNFKYFSDELNIFVVTEYILDYPSRYFQLLIIDLQNKRIAIYGRIKDVFIIPKLIDNDKLIFERDSDNGIKKEYEISLNQLDWQKLI